MFRVFRFRAILTSIVPRFTYLRAMSSHAYLDASPPPYHGPYDALDKSAFRKTLSVLAARIPPNKTGQVLKAHPLKTCVWFVKIHIGLLKNSLEPSWIYQK
jgi:tRNA (guanine37-N1)-methyltransferase